MPESNIKVAIVGANGRIGHLLVEKIKADNHFDKPLALVRTKEQEEKFINQVGINASLTSIEHASVNEIAEAIKGNDAVVFTAGAGGKGVERIFTVDLDGCVKAMEACEQAGVKRFIVVSAIKAEDRSFWWELGGLREYYIAKRAADHDVRQSKLDYTIVQPGYLTSEPGTEKVLPLSEVDDAIKNNKVSVSREDVATFIKKIIVNPGNTIRNTIPLLNGETSMDEFLSNL